MIKAVFAFIVDPSERNDRRKKESNIHPHKPIRPSKIATTVSRTESRLESEIGLFNGLYMQLI